VEFTPVASSMIGAVAYDDERRDLHVRFASGQTYTYADVPREVFEALLAAESAGRYLNASVKGRYAHRAAVQAEE
jgi:hypothetical protein